MNLAPLACSLLFAARPAPRADAGAVPSAKAGSDALWRVLGHFDEYPGATPYQLSDEMKVGQATLQMAGFSTADAPEKVVAFYRAEFQREKMYLPDPPSDDLPFSGITAFDPAGNLEKTVMVSPGNGGLTRVILSVSPGTGLIPKSLATGNDPPAGLPVYPQSEGLYRTDAQDGPRMSSTVSYRAPGNPNEVLTFLRKDLSEKGWVQGQDQGAGSGLRYLRRGESVELTLLPLGEKATAVTYVYAR